MMSLNQDVSLQTLSATDGFLAGLIYLSATKPATTQRRVVVSFTNARQTWKYLEDIWLNLENVRNRTLELVPRLRLAGVYSTLDCFINPVQFFQAAVLSLRNTLIGRPPNTFGDVVALFCLSQIMSRHLRSCHNLAMSDSQFDIDQWGNTISRYDHRQAFASLIRALFPEITPAASPSGFLEPATYQATPFEPPLRESELIGSFSGYSDMIPNLLSLVGFQPTDQEAHNDLYTFGETGFQTLAPLDPHGSALVANFTLFLEQCGDLFQNLSGSWVTAMNQYSPSSALNRARPQSNDVSSYLQRMRQGGSFQDPSSMGILSIVDTFVQLGYLQTPKDVQEYMIIVGKRICKFRGEHPWDGFPFRLQKPLCKTHHRAKAEKVLLFHMSETVHKKEQYAATQE
ncbi:uncharacterized protein LW94_4079 [Fusarium fujikuroi]|nr:uncharacterized protein LW94_4079 [Fusarium fujikuroi]